LLLGRWRWRTAHGGRQLLAVAGPYDGWEDRCARGEALYLVLDDVL
jgi:hypothetical protein